MNRRLVITGTRRGHPAVKPALDLWCDWYGVPELLIIGDATGVDAQALTWARLFRRLERDPPLRWRRFEVYRDLPSPDRFHDRNQRMVDAARPGDHLLAFPDARSRGTWDCYGRGERAGLLCVDATIDGWLDRLAEMDAGFRARTGG